MTLYDEYHIKIENLITNSLSISPNNKMNVLRFDNLPKHGGYMQYYFTKNINNIHFDELEKRSNIILDFEKINESYNISTENKTVDIIKLHNDGQQLISEIIPKVYQLIKDNPNIYQAKLVELSGFTKDTLKDNNRTMVTIFDIMIHQGMITKYKESKNTYFNCLKEKEYKTFDYVEYKNAKSKYEAEFADYLKKQKMPFKQQVTLQGCKYKKLLPFDFVVNVNGTELYIEIDGRQHYEFTPYFHKTIEDFNLQQIRDKIKDNFAKEKDLNFLRIRYDQDMINVFEEKCKEL